MAKSYMGGVQAPSYTAPAAPSYRNYATGTGVGAGLLAGAGVLSGGTAFLITGLTQLASGLLGAFTSKPPKREITFEEKHWNEVVGAYANLAARVDTARAVMVALNPGTSIEDYEGSENTKMMFDKLRARGFNVSNMNEKYDTVSTGEGTSAVYFKDRTEGMPEPESKFEESVAASIKAEDRPPSYMKRESGAYPRDARGWEAFMMSDDEDDE